MLMTRAYLRFPHVHGELIVFTAADGNEKREREGEGGQGRGFGVESLMVRASYRPKRSRITSCRRAV